MIFLFPPKYRYMYWSCLLVIGVIVLSVFFVFALINGDLMGALVVGLLDLPLILMVRHMAKRIQQIRAEEASRMNRQRT